LSSGSKINSGSDDAAGLSLVNGLAANSAALTQSTTNATEGVGLLQVADGALSQVTSLLNRAVTLATEASNGTLNQSQTDAADQEYQSILSEISQHWIDNHLQREPGLYREDCEHLHRRLHDHGRVDRRIDN